MKTRLAVVLAIPLLTLLGESAVAGTPPPLRFEASGPGVAKGRSVRVA